MFVVNRIEMFSNAPWGIFKLGKISDKLCENLMNIYEYYLWNFVNIYIEIFRFVLFFKGYSRK